MMCLFIIWASIKNICGHFVPLHITPLKPSAYYAPPGLGQNEIAHFDP